MWGDLGALCFWVPEQAAARAAKKSDAEASLFL